MTTEQIIWTVVGLGLGGLLLYGSIKHTRDKWREMQTRNKWDREKWKDWGIEIAVALGIVAFIAWAIVRGLSADFGSKSPCAYLEKGKYQAEFYVHLYPEGNPVKSYKVPAMIYAHTEVEDYGDTADDDPIHGGGQSGTTSYRNYDILYARLPNGGIIKFDPNRLDAADTLEVNKPTSRTDENGRTWGVELTCEPVSGAD